MSKNVLITGITGMLGSSVYKSFLETGNYQLFGVSRQTDFVLDGVKMFCGDLSSKDFVKSLSHISFSFIIHCSAEINVNFCETNKDLANNSNVIATENVFSLLKAKKYIYISTDSVFDGQNGNYTEISKVNPLNYYAETKLQGEELVKKLINNYYILRTNIYGFKKPMKSSLFEWGYTELNKGEEINGFVNMFFNPMYVGQLAKLIKELCIIDGEFGTYNVSSSEKISKYDFLLKIAHEFNFTTTGIRPLKFDQNDFIAKRALNTVLDNSKIQSLFKDFDFSFNSGFSLLKKDLKNG